MIFFKSLKLLFCTLNPGLVFGPKDKNHQPQAEAAQNAPLHTQEGGAHVFNGVDLAVKNCGGGGGGGSKNIKSQIKS